MLLNKINNYLKESSENSAFKINIEENGGYLKFSNTGKRGSRKFFTIGLNAINNMLKDIRDNITEFQQNTNYIEQKWRDLSQYYTDETIKSIATVQTKPLFVTISKVINWANGNKSSNENSIDLSEEAIQNTIKLIDDLILLFTPHISNKETEKFINAPLDNDWKFPHKNLLLKGVPGTGKSHTLEKIIENYLNLKDKPKHICHINIHSASSNADLMQGIGINSNGGKIEYKEKQGLIYNHIKKALFTPNQPFVLILEEIQENSLNELIGDLIYLIEVKKRVSVDTTKFEDGKEYEYQEFIEKVLEDKDNKHSIQIPYLVDTSTAYRKMVLPSNLYIFCTSNYRDDKKVIEDNLLRRFDVVEVYPQYKGVLKSDDMAKFLEKLNKDILEQFKRELHPDRYLVGHANWLDITNKDNDENKKLFYTALLKVIIEFKEIREVDFDAYVKPILKKLFDKGEHLSTRIEKYLNDCNFDLKSDKYKEIVEKLQSKIYSFL